MAVYTMALERYDRHVPFFTGAVEMPPGIEIAPLEVGIDHDHRDGRNRHERMIRDREFDICELSFSSYIMAIDRGADFTATPVFPRRLFSQNHIMFAPIQASNRRPISSDARSRCALSRQPCPSLSKAISNSSMA